MKVYVGQGLVVLGLAMGLAACGPKLQSVSETDGSGTQDPSRRETIKVGINFSEKGAGFQLADATDFSMSLLGCASGLTYPSITKSDDKIDVYRFDQGCYVKLNSFNLNTINYVPTAGDPFETEHPVNDFAIFADEANPSNTLRVKVASQLTFGGILNTDNVSFSYTEIVKGADEQVAKNIVSDEHTLSVGGVDAAKVAITKVTMKGMTSAGAGLFEFEVSCTEAVNAGACAGNALTSLKYRLVKNTWTGEPSYNDINDLFASAGTQVDALDVLATTSNGFGGFKTVQLSTPDQMHTLGNGNLLFVVQSGGMSYKYFKVNIERLSY
jgi:hypothetical protein